CSSGGLRMDYAMLSRYSIQSTSDQDDYRKYCTIAANAPLALTPEQAAVWSYPMWGGDREQTAFNMINAMLLRIHQSGHLANIDEQSKRLVKSGIAVYKKIRKDIKTALPFWSIGTFSFSDEWVSLGLRCESCAYIAVWRRQSAQSCISLPVDFLKGKNVSASCIYPDFADEEFSWNKENGTLSVRLKNQFSARLFKLDYGE
ncbi:MAG: alpha-galactosidase, partial [Oscillospiraceae bacterium]